MGVGAVRELYGAVQAEGADKGILVTSSSFTVPARKFAEGKPLELMDGTRLRSLIGKQQQTTREDDTKSYGIRKQLTFTSSINKPGIHAGVESDSVFEPIKALVFRGYVANHTSQSIFRPEVSITLRDKHTGERFTATSDVKDLVLPPGISAPFDVRFVHSLGGYPEAWAIDVIEATEGDGKHSYLFSENVGASLYRELDVSLLGETSNLAYQFQIINTGDTTPEYVQVFFDAVDKDDVYLGTFSGLVSQREHGPLLPGETGTFEADDLMIYLPGVNYDEEPERSISSIRMRYVGFVPGLVKFRPENTLPGLSNDHEDNLLFSSGDIGIHRIS